MDVPTPSIAAIGVIGCHNNPLHIALFPAIGPGDTQVERALLEYSLMLNSCLDIFEARMPSKPVGHDFGLLHALDERIAMYGWLLNTGVKLVIVVDMEGRRLQADGPRAGINVAGLGLRGNDLMPAFLALQTAYVRLLQNPFYVPDEHNPKIAKGRYSLEIKSAKFIREVDRIGRTWQPAIGSL